MGVGKIARSEMIDAAVELSVGVRAETVDDSAARERGGVHGWRAG